MFKRLVAAAFVTVLTVVGVAPAATAAPGDHGNSRGGASQLRIDWD